jgi:DNA-binding transcriptional LysR family regulator
VDIRFLTTFLEVAETRHFGRAAENLYLTQSAVSARIKLLEEYFNTALFIRNRNSIQISPAGEKLIPFAQALSDTLSKARKSLAQEECQHISCASTQNAFLLCFSNLQPNLLMHFNNVSFQHEIATVEQITRQLHEHSIDFALTTSQVKSDDIDSTLLFEVSLCMYQSNGSNGITNSEVHDINIEWSASVNDKLAKLHPELRKAKLRTSSIDVAVTMACAEQSRLVLPIASHSFLDPKLHQVLASFAPSELAQTIKIPVYLNKLKSQNNVGVQEVTAYMQLAVQ